MTTLAEKLAAKRAEMQAAGIQPTIKPEPKAPEFDADLIPEIEKNERTEESLEIDQVLARVGVVDAYRRWCGKMEPAVGGKTESIMVSCPKPEHPDRRPSAWLNSDKDTWFCGGCQEGGDIYDIFAYNNGWAVPGYKSPSEFPKMRRAMAETLGYVVRKTAGNQYVLERQNIVVEDEQPLGTPVADPDPGSVATDPVQPVVGTPDPAVATVTPLHVAQGDVDEILDYPQIAWKKIAPENTFLHDWMNVTSKDDLPEEYYFWLGMQALGFAIGNDVVLMDNPSVKANLYVCLFGKSGQGKSRATAALLELLKSALPMEWDNPNTKGVYSVPSPGSAEALIDSFSWPQYDPSDPKKVAFFAPIRGLVRFDELSALASRAERSGNPLKPALMELYDGYAPVEIRSRTAGMVRAENYFSQMLTTTQPRAIRALLSQTDVDSGFINRVIFASGRPKPSVAYGRDKLDIPSTVSPLQDVRAWAGFGKQIHLRGDALRIWDEFYHKTIQMVRNQDDTNLLTRVDLTLKKCMVLLHANSRDMADEISVETVEAVKLIWDYLLQSYQILGGDIGMGPLEECRRQVDQAIKRYIERTGKSPAMRDIKRAMVNSTFGMDLIAKTISYMVQFGELTEEIHKPQRGPSTTRYATVAG